MAIMQWGLEGGILAGIVLATLYFALAYAKSQVGRPAGQVESGRAVCSAPGVSADGGCQPQPASRAGVRGGPGCLPAAAPMHTQWAAGPAVAPLQVAAMQVVDAARSSVVRTVEQQVRRGGGRRCLHASLPFALACMHAFMCDVAGPGPGVPTFAPC